MQKTTNNYFVTSSPSSPHFASPLFLKRKLVATGQQPLCFYTLLLPLHVKGFLKMATAMCAATTENLTTLDAEHP
jgi:hypothetical protein